MNRGEVVIYVYMYVWVVVVVVQQPERVGARKDVSMHYVHTAVGEPNCRWEWKRESGRDGDEVATSTDLLPVCYPFW